METAVAALVLISVHGTTVLLISKRQPTGTLVWDGASWYWHPNKILSLAAGDFGCRLDVQGVMCLRLQRQDTRQAWRWPRVGGQAALWVWLGGGTLLSDGHKCDMLCLLAAHRHRPHPLRKPMTEQQPSHYLRLPVILLTCNSSKRTLAEDTRAFDLLVMKYQRRIQQQSGAWSVMLIWSKKLRRETFLRAYRALHQFRGDAQFIPGCTELLSTMPESVGREKTRSRCAGQHFYARTARAGNFTQRSEPNTETPISCWQPREIAAEGQYSYAGYHRTCVQSPDTARLRD